MASPSQMSFGERNDPRRGAGLRMIEVWETSSVAQPSAEHRR